MRLSNRFNKMVGNFEVQALEARQMLTATPVALAVTSVTTALGIELRINGTNGGDTIGVYSATGGFLIKSGTGWSKQYNGAFADIRVSGLDGNDRIAVSSAVKVPTLLFGGNGNDSLVGGAGNDSIYGGAGIDTLSGGAGNDTLVSYATGDAKTDKDTGGAGLDTFWLDSASTETITDLDATESRTGAMHRIASFSAGGSTTTNTTALTAQGLTSLADPILTSSASAYKNFSSSPLFAKTGPSYNDIKQGQLGDCYLLASLASVAKVSPAEITQLMVDLGDGTYAVQFIDGGTRKFVRVDADLPVDRYGNIAYAQLGGGKSLWVALYEKAYAFFRYSTASYGSIEGGYMADVYEDMGLKNTSLFSVASGADLLKKLQGLTNAGEAVTFGTKQQVGTAPVIGGHAYVVDKIITDSTGKPTSVRLRNPWGIDGAGNDGKNDGFVTLTAAQALSVFWFACAATIV